MVKDLSIELQKETAPIVKKAQSLVIKDDATMLTSVELLSQINLFLDKAKKEKDSIIAPAKEIIKRENARWAPNIDPLEEAKEIIRTRQSEYQTLKLAQAQEEEEKIISRVAPGKGNLSPETAVRKLVDIKRPEEKVTSNSGSVQFRSHQQVKIITLSEIPFEYFDLNQSKVLNALKAGIEVPGAMLETIQIPINRR